MCISYKTFFVDSKAARMLHSLFRRHLSSLHNVSKIKTKTIMKSPGLNASKASKSVSEMCQDISTDLYVLGKKLDIMDMRLDILGAELDIMAFQRTRKIQRLEKTTGEFGRGEELESKDQNAQSLKDVSMDPVFVNRREYELDGIDHVEIDVFSRNPPFIMEYDAYLAVGDVEKIEYLGKVRRALSDRHNVNFKCYLVAPDVRNEDRAEIAQICKKEGIAFITII